jgi:cell division protein FtsZ
MSVTVITSSAMMMPEGALAPEFVPRIVPAPAHAAVPAPIVHAAPEPFVEAVPATVRPERFEPEIEAAPEPELVTASASSAGQDGQASLIDVAPHSERPSAEVLPVRVPRAPRQPRILTAATDPQPARVAVAASRPREEKQETLQFEPVTRGRFEKSEPTIVDGQDLDVPTFLRRNLKVS